MKTLAVAASSIFLNLQPVLLKSRRSWALHEPADNMNDAQGMGGQGDRALQTSKLWVPGRWGLFHAAALLYSHYWLLQQLIAAQCRIGRVEVKIGVFMRGMERARSTAPTESNLKQAHTVGKNSLWPCRRAADTSQQNLQNFRDTRTYT